MRTLSCNLQNFGLTYVYVVDPGAEQWPDKIVGLRRDFGSEAKWRVRVITGTGFLLE